MLPVGFEPTISAGERPQTYALDRAATGTGLIASTFAKLPNNVQCGSSGVLTVTHVLVSGNVTIRLQSVQELVRVAVVR